MTLPTATVSQVSGVTVPSVSPAVISAVVAAVCVWPVPAGTDTVGSTAGTGVPVSDGLWLAALPSAG